LSVGIEVSIHFGKVFLTGRREKNWTISVRSFNWDKEKMLELMVGGLTLMVFIARESPFSLMAR
jgi:hypothetical protein